MSRKSIGEKIVLVMLLSFTIFGVFLLKRQKDQIEKLNEIAMSSSMNRCTMVLYLNRGDVDKAKNTGLEGIRESALGLVSFEIQTPASMNLLRHMLKFRNEYEDSGLTDDDWKRIRNFIDNNTE